MIMSMFFLAPNDTLSWLIPLLVGIICLVGGAAAGVLVYRNYRNKKIGTTQAQADTILDYAKEEAATLKKDAIREAIGNKSNTCIIFINQLRDKIGVMFGNPETTTGGKALKFYASVRLDVRRVDQVKDGSEIVGSKTRVKVVKNKVAPPFKTAEFEIIFGKGISNSGCVLDMAVANGIIEKSGSWFSYNGEKVGQGRENVKQWLEKNPDIMAEVEEKVKAAVQPVQE